MQLADRVKDISPFIVMEVLERAQALEAQGRNIIHLEVGEPDFDTPQIIKEAQAKALAEGHTHYTHSMGDPALREALAAFYEKRYGVKVSADRFIITSGTSPGLMLLFGAFMNPGREIIMSDPHYACYPNIVTFFGGRPRYVAVREEEGFLYRPEDIKAALNDNTAAVMINSPANPFGTVLGPARLRDIAALDRLVISDEIYHGLSYGSEPEHSYLEYTENTVVIGGFSKAFAMTGWRVGYLILPPEMVRTMQKLSQNFFISVNAAAQKAAVCALESAWPEVEAMRRVYDRRRKILYQGLNKLGLTVKVEPTGAFYILANARHLDRNSYRLAFDILEKADVGVAPGIDFGAGAEGYLRFSYAASEENIEEALSRLAVYLERRG